MGKLRGYWWQGISSERFWCEITDRKDIGANLLCPQTDETGKAYWSYSLINEIRPNDIVFHYSTPQKAFVGASIAIGTVTDTEMEWTPHGTVGRSKNTARENRPAWKLPLTRFVRPKESLTMAKIQDDQEWVREWTRSKRESVTSVETPFQVRPKGLRACQGYLTKMPLDFVMRWPELRILAEKLGAPKNSDEYLNRVIENSSNEEDAVLAVTAHLKSRTSGQGFQVSPELRKAIERYAVEKAKAHFIALGYEVKEHGKPYDLECWNGGDRLYVEVKGTTTKGTEVLMTPNEVAFASTHKGRMALFVVREIDVASTDSGPALTGGSSVLLEPWDIETGTLTPLGYSYELPSDSDRVLKPSLCRI